MSDATKQKLREARSRFEARKKDGKMEVFWTRNIILRNIPVEDCTYCVVGKFLRTPTRDRCPICMIKKNHP